MKAYKIELLVIDFDEIGSQGIISEIENANYANDCISPRVKAIVEKDIGEWSDDHPMNKFSTCDQFYKRIFDI
jgi:hypothetical protein